MNRGSRAALGWIAVLVFIVIAGLALASRYIWP